ncbi:siderophore-iron reductase FhuF (plasmid) [Rhizobium rosettiformans]|uniref:Siderophore-iron reductase FhuF n=1 Tax=Rhizobium rosettiformans TaxID=1368430 RepID=A0ABX7F1P0_9HYPH|nr:siderophore-iron reductase FhuF [Rhizobium rosettiformans]QRF54232.1 siderophore-iron reductase FhuF [Rhizobium rosettiformans]
MSGISSPQDLLQGLSGPLAPIRDRLSCGPEIRRIVPSVDVLEADTFAVIIQSYARRFGVEPDRHLVSLWSQKYLATVIIPVMALSMIGGRAVKADIETIAIVVDEDGEPVAMRLPSSFTAEDAGQAAALLVSTHLTALVDALAHWSGLSRKVFWGNAAHYLEWIVRQLPGGNPGFALPAPMTDAIRYVEENGLRVRRRKVCCLRDRVRGIEDCGSLCPDRVKRIKP